MPSTPSQKSIDVCRSAPTIVMWWTPWLWSLRIGYPFDLVLDEFRLVLAALQAAPRHELDAGLDHERRRAVARGSPPRARDRPPRPGASSTLTGSGGSCLTPGARGRTRMCPLTVGREGADHLAHRGREDVDPAHDQHVVGAPDAAHARAGAPARARARPDHDVVARAEAQQRRGAVAQVRQDELAASRRPPSRARRRSPGRSARRGRSRARRGACRPAPRTRPTARRRCRRCPSPRSRARPSPPRARRGTPARRRRARPRRARARRSSRAGRRRARPPTRAGSAA